MVLLDSSLKVDATRAPEAYALHEPHAPKAHPTVVHVKAQRICLYRLCVSGSLIAEAVIETLFLLM
ncbi:hypothetical protein TSUD_34750 [Trifolium subterraneum]|uniref:Uncharacterized protein n=1 Tax=Trifolium subterraneum TaxID=3900 RepID=A0A2Z6M7W7_TRISU|nr:hypothetical protein TSUD_34750 [Trifolium subterraneum]